MADCYPQGCPPCTEEISFPENPINGQRECFHIGKDPNTGEDILKCWVYDQCVPGWRAEGPATAPISFKGQVDLTKDEAGNSITAKEAGDYYIVAVGSESQQFLTSNWFDLQHEVNKGAFVLWSGSEWMEIPRPCVGGEEADCALDVTPDPDTRESGVIVIASVEEVKEGTDKCKAVTPYTLQKGIKDSDLFDATCVDLDPEATPSNPDNVAIFEPVEVDGETTWRIGCKDLTLGTNSLFGVGKIATAYSNDADSYGDGYYSDWLTNSAMAPIINAIQERLSKLEENNPGSGVPTETVRVIRAYRNSNNPYDAGQTNEFNWTPVDAANLVHIDIVAAGGSGGAACSENSSVATGVTSSAPNSVYVLKENIPESAHGNNLTFTVGDPGRGTGKGVTPNYPATPGGDSVIPLTNFEDIIAGGSNAGNGQLGTPSSGFDRNISEGLTVIYGGGRDPNKLDNQAGPCPVSSGWGAEGQGGNVLIYEHYPVGWEDPRPDNFVNF